MGNICKLGSCGLLKQKLIEPIRQVSSSIKPSKTQNIWVGSCRIWVHTHLASYSNLRFCEVCNILKRNLGSHSTNSITTDHQSCCNNKVSPTDYESISIIMYAVYSNICYFRMTTMHERLKECVLQNLMDQLNGYNFSINKKETR